MRIGPTGATVVAGVAGNPVRHSLSPILHNAWISSAAIDAVYIAFSPKLDGFAAFAEGLRGGVIRGLNVTAPFKEDALRTADVVSDSAAEAGAANLLIFDPVGRILADNTDGLGLLAACAEQAPMFDPRSGPVVILGAGGAARGAATALLNAGAPEIIVVNRSVERGGSLVDVLGARSRLCTWDDVAPALAQASLVINATTLGLHGVGSIAIPWDRLVPDAVVLDMIYRPLRTEFLEQAKAAGHATVDGLAMLIGQAAPSFEAFFGMSPPDIDVRRIALSALEGSE